MKTYKNIYDKLCMMNNLANAWRKARKGKTKKDYVIGFEKSIRENLLNLRKELINQTYKPKLLITFIIRDPKTRKISKSDFRDRIVHHALIRIIEPLFDKIFIYDSCANRKNKGTLFALKRFDKFRRKVTNNLHSEAFCLKADIKHYFPNVNNEILLNILNRRISDEKVIWLIKQILANSPNNLSNKQAKTGMPLGNLTSQFFANVYLNELDYFVKYELKIKYYLRYVDDFVILHKSREQLEIWKQQINRFLNEKLKLELHSQKSKIISLERGIDFVGFRDYWNHKLLRKRSIRRMLFTINKYKYREINSEKLLESFQGWQAYAKWADSYNLRIKLKEQL